MSVSADTGNDGAVSILNVTSGQIGSIVVDGAGSGYEIPAISITRYPFPEYHSQFDTPDILKEVRLIETLETLEEIVNTLESSKYLNFTGKGLYCLSQPRYELYQQVWDPSNKNGPINREDGRAMNLLMTEMPRRINGQMSIQDLAEDYDLPYEKVYNYCMQWVESGLAEIKN